MNKHEFLVGGKQIETQTEKSSEGYTVRVGNQSYNIQQISEGLFSVAVDGRRKIIAAATVNGTTFVDIDSVVVELQEPSHDGFAGGASDHAEAPDKIFAPMPGKIVKLMVAVGDTVEPKQQVVIVEAMKMENPVPARAKGTVKAINFSVGDQVTTEEPIVELELAK
ncbi:MAG: biotin/lipoyl-containing protein [Candidatus Zixiibacteriota bacterium]